VASERPLELAPHSAKANLELGVERVQAKEVAVRAVPARRARAAPAARPEIVPPLGAGRLTLPQRARRRVDVPGQPVRKRPDGRVGVVDDERQRARPRRRVAPGQRGRDVLALARVATGDLAAARERLAAQRELAHGNELRPLRDSAPSVGGAYRVADPT